MQKARSQAVRRRPSYRLSAHGFRIYFTRHLAFFSPFPHGTRALSVIERVFSLGGWSPQIRRRIPRAPRYSGYQLGAVRVSLTGLSPSLAGRSRPLHSRCRASHVVVPQPRGSKLPRFGLFPVRSPLLGESRLISLPPGTEMFQFPGLALPCGSDGTSTPAGFPHSDILGSQLACSSPRLIAAYHVLHRLSMPRHPPCALLRLISNSFVRPPILRSDRRDRC